ncbi:MAG: tRNA uridine-5-carboxymethylaminomethyl(34) synthesis enzyme MnmG [Candidatus Wallbacteria bacterium]|nr:tRNA uridine-5-carboxymethylaminomethyl(34) synthesis enzyme MnmG [Candidatus Wallbacteria bacterium]
MRTFPYEVIIVGGGHAGCEAALAAARMGFSTILLTMNVDAVALTPCNPSMGGPGKGHLVNEIDALGGEIARNTERSYIQVRTLNQSKGPAVQSWRAQIDKRLYQENMLSVLQRQPGLDLHQAEVSEIMTDGRNVLGVVTRTGIEYTAPAVVLCTGTYLRSFLVVGPKRFAGGPHNQPPSFSLGLWLEGNGFALRRLQTATPCRVAKDSLDYSVFTALPGETPHPDISAFLRMPERPQFPSYQTCTSEATTSVIRDNLSSSPLVIGNIVNTGPRHCPSIDRKVINFPEKSRHQVFIEPEGTESGEMYIQGATSATPPEVQLAVLKTLPGFQSVRVTRFGYGIEYDALESSELTLSLESRRLNGLFFAGQINGTSGYEEAAAQGLMAGINAALKARGDRPFHLLRDQAYIGVMIDDLITKSFSEPYRMYTSRAEFRLLLRPDNATRRLSRIGRRLGLLSPCDYEKIREHWCRVLSKLRQMKKTFFFPDAQTNSTMSAIGSAPLRKPVTGMDVLSRPEIGCRDFSQLLPTWKLSEPDFNLLKREAVYAGYWQRHKSDIERFRSLERVSIANTDFAAIPGLSNEARERLCEIRPANLGQAARLQGVKPADITVLWRYLKNHGL